MQVSLLFHDRHAESPAIVADLPALCCLELPFGS
jgi:hypothetical protein